MKYFADFYDANSTQLVKLHYCLWKQYQSECISLFCIPIKRVASYASNIVTITLNFQTFLKISLSSMQIKIEKIKMIGIWVIDFIYVKHIFRQNDASFQMMLLFSVSAKTYKHAVCFWFFLKLSDFQNLVIFNSVLYLCWIFEFSQTSCVLCCGRIVL